MRFEKKFILTVTICLVLCMLAGCTNGKNKITVDETPTYEPVLENDLDDYEEEKLDLSKYSVRNTDKTDANTELLWFNIAVSEYGYYYFEPNGYDYIMFWDKASGEVVPLCNRPECEHVDSDCNAYYGSESEEHNVCFVTSYLQYNDGYIYMLAYDDEGYTYLYRISEDGSTCEQYMKLFKQDLSVPGNSTSTQYSAPEICIHRGYVYYIHTRESEQKLRRMKLGSDNEEIVFQLNIERSNMYRIRPYGDFVFLQAGYYTDETYKTIIGGIFAYNTTNGELALLRDKAVSTYTVIEDMLYYSHVDGLYKYDLLSGVNTKIIDKDFYTEFSTDGQYIYYGDIGALKIYNMEGEHIASADNENLIVHYYGDGEYLFALEIILENNTSYSYINILDVANIGTEKCNWLRLE